MFTFSTLNLTAFFLLVIFSIICSSYSLITDHYLLNCGLTTATTATAIDNRTWYSDNNTTFTSSADLTAATSTATTESLGSSQVPCSTARIFHSNFTYSFPVSPGPKFLRLYFCPTTTGTTPASASALSLLADGGAGSFTLLQNYSAFPGQPSSHDGMTQLEFLLVVNNMSQLNLTFFPSYPNSVASINGIEIVSIPDRLYKGFYDDDTTEFPCGAVRNLDSPNTQYSTGGNPVAMEKVVRLNVGGYNVAPDSDSGGMFRVWLNDEKFVDSNFMGAAPKEEPIKINYSPSLVPEYTAPEVVYRTARVMGSYSAAIKMRNNLTWEIPVNPGFMYLIRLHFCEIDPDITATNQRVFNIYINNQMADRETDVMELANNVWATPVCTDYAVSATDDFTLWISLHPDIEQHPKFHDAILNGLEVFKLSQWNRNLASIQNITSPDQPKINQRKPKKKKINLFAIIGGVAAGIAVTLASSILVAVWWRSSVRDKGSNNNGSGSGSGSGSKQKDGSTTLPSHLCERFKLSQIRLATSNFDEKMVIGVGGFGKVYKGYIPMDGGELTTTTTTAASNVAVKRLNPSSNQGAHEFRTEIEMLSVLRHVHLVSLIGYCDEGQEMILVYEYMPRGTLRDHLYNRNPNPNPPLPWKQRLTAVIGAARGLHYLHVGTNHSIIHRDVKSTNILLDEKLTAKVSDFGLSKVGPTAGVNHVSTLVKGSIGYLDPEYHRWQQLTTKSDVYSFGVVLFEVLCGRPAINSALPKDQVNLALWGRSNYTSGTLEDIVDPNLSGQIAPECLRKFGEVAELCVREQGSERLSMGDVVWGLEFCLQLQISAEKTEDLVNVDSGLNPVYVDNKNGSATVGDNSSTLISSYNSNGTTTSNVDVSSRSGFVFSEIMNPQAR